MPHTRTRNDAREIQVSELCDLLADFAPTETVDLGTTILHVGTHVHQGKLVLISTLCGRAARITL